MSNRYRNSRANRWEEITHQEQLILAKKREIEERLKSSEDGEKGEGSSKKDIPSSNSTIFNSSSTISDSTSSIPLSSLSSSSQINPTNVTIKPSVASSSSGNVNDSNTSGTTNNLDKQAFTNKFSNDGSFMEMFRKMQQKNSDQSCSSNSAIVQKPEEPKSSSLVDTEPPKLEDIDERVRSCIKQEPSESEDEPQSKKVSPSGDDEIRMAIEKSAIYVAMNGSEAEDRLRSDSVNDSNYRWLYQEGSVNHQYYKRRVAELKEAKSRAADFELSSPLTQQQSNNLDDTSLAIGQNDQDERHQSVDVKGKKRKESRWSSGPSSSSSQRSVHEDDYQESSPIEAPQDPELVKYAIQVYGKCDLTTDQWKQLEDQRKMKVLVAMLERKKAKRAKFEASGRPMYQYDSDEEIDDGGTWEHKKRMKEMEKTKEWADKLTEMNKGKHHLGDFLPPDQLERFMKKWDSIKDGSTSLLFDEDYQDFKLQSQNQGYKMLEKLGWTEGQGLGVDNQGTTKPVDADGAWGERAGLGQKRPDQLKTEDDEYEAYRKRMMLAYRFRPNPLNNPRRPYY